MFLVVFGDIHIDDLQSIFHYTTKISQRAYQEEIINYAYIYVYIYI